MSLIIRNENYIYFDSFWPDKVLINYIIFHESLLLAASVHARQEQFEEDRVTWQRT